MKGDENAEYRSQNSEEEEVIGEVVNWGDELSISLKFI